MTKSTPSEFFSKVKDELTQSTVAGRNGSVGLSPLSVKVYTDRLRTLEGHEGLVDYQLFLDTYPSKGGLPMKETTKISYNSAVMGMIKHSPTFAKEMGHLKDEIGEQQKGLVLEREKKEKTGVAHEDEKLLTKEDWQVAKIRAKGLQSLLLKFYEKIPPRRGDYGRVKLLHADELKGNTEDNYLNIDTMELTIFPLKTGQKYGSQTIKLPDDLAEDVRQSLKEQNRRFLFVNARGLSFPDHIAFTKWVRTNLHKLTNKTGMGVTAIRHFVISEYWKDIPSLTKMEEFAHKSGHSFEMSQRYRKTKKEIEDFKEKHYN